MTKSNNPNADSFFLKIKSLKKAYYTCIKSSLYNLNLHYTNLPLFVLNIKHYNHEPSYSKNTIPTYNTFFEDILSVFHNDDLVRKYKRLIIKVKNICQSSLKLMNDFSPIINLSK